ncbi:hypothetical protein L1987_48824 [Smallanthus sonchifolius]|uniref:Uncharacterized protein n=1 Tax=Smallanthus sonchifolius TaxID=185202 RepID=A0ACB9FTJ4_9ASTR|nr:hypothetical protein L1987_48824 [Smallanthus sonchifolius]
MYSFSRQNCKVMDLNHDNDVVVMKTKKKKLRSLWTDDTHMIFLELCLNEVRVGNKPTGKCDSDEINVSSDDQEPIFSENSSTKSKKSKNVASSRSTKRKTSITSAFEDKLANVMQALSSRSSQLYPSQNPSPSTKECMDIVLTFPGFEEGSRNYYHALDIFLKRQARENFMVPTSDVAKMEFLKYLTDK